MASDLVTNERLKLSANALDRASTASLTIGVIAPLAAIFYEFGGAGTNPILLPLGAAIWLLTAAVLHWGARVVLGGLRS